jgi:hypothetical protein
MVDAIVTRHWVEWIVEGSDLKRELVVETSLETTPGASGFDQSAIQEVAVAAPSFGNTDYDRISIVPKRRHNASRP